MHFKIFSLSSLICISAFFELCAAYDRRSLLPFYIKRRMCEIDETLLLCKKKEPTPKPNPYNMWALCDDFPNMRLCKYHPERGAPLPTVAPTSQRALETFNQRFDTVKPALQAASVTKVKPSTTTTMKPSRFDGRLRFPEREMQRSSELRDRGQSPAPKEDAIEEGSFVANDNIFDSL